MSIKKQIKAEAIKAVAKRAWVKRFKPNCATHKYAKELFEAGAAFRDRWWAERWIRASSSVVVPEGVPLTKYIPAVKKQTWDELDAAAKEILG